VAVEDYATQLERVQSAIAAIEGGAQSYSIAGRSLSRADLRTLYEREAWLRKMVDRVSRGGIRIRLGTPV
jgi:hypothetical protein